MTWTDVCVSPQIYGNLGKGKCSPQSKNGLRFQEFASHQQRFTLVNLPIRLKLKKSHKEIIYSHFLKTNGYPTQSFFWDIYIYIHITFILRYCFSLNFCPDLVGFSMKKSHRWMTWMCQATCGKYATSTTINGRVVGTGLGLTGRMRTVGVFSDRTRLHFYTKSFFVVYYVSIYPYCFITTAISMCVSSCLYIFGFIFISMHLYSYASLFMPTYQPI